MYWRQCNIHAQRDELINFEEMSPGWEPEKANAPGKRPSGV